MTLNIEGLKELGRKAFKAPTENETATRRAVTQRVFNYFGATKLTEVPVTRQPLIAAMFRQWIDEDQAQVPSGNLTTGPPAEGPLADLKVQQGDVVQFVCGEHVGDSHREKFVGFKYTANTNGGVDSSERGAGGGWSPNCPHIFRVISRAKQAEKPETGTLSAIGAQVGDTVECVSESIAGEQFILTEEDLPLMQLDYRIVSRAADKPEPQPDPVQDDAPKSSSAAYAEIVEALGHAIRCELQDGTYEKAMEYAALMRQAETKVIEVNIRVPFTGGMFKGSEGGVVGGHWR